MHRDSTLIPRRCDAWEYTRRKLASAVRSRYPRQGTITAVTAAGAVLTSLPPQVDFNSPYIFVLADNKADNILFIGRISDPR